MAAPTKAEVSKFVKAAHGDLPRIQQMLAAKPEILLLTNGNETALGAACQMRRGDIITFLLGQGECMDISATCVLGLSEQVSAFLDTDPSLLSQGNKRAHNRYPLCFAEGQPEVLALLKARGAK